MTAKTKKYLLWGGIAYVAIAALKAHNSQQQPAPKPGG